jgi:hypothetical protein
MATADKLEYCCLVCELGLSLLAVLFLHLGRTADTSSVVYVSASVSALVLTAAPVLMGLWFIYTEHRLKDNDAAPEVPAETCNSPDKVATAAAATQETTKVADFDNPLHAEEDN